MRNNLDERIKDKLNERTSRRKWYQRITSIVLSLTMVLSFITPLDMWDFIKPGFAITNNNLNDGLDYFDGPYTGSVDGFVDYTDYITGKFKVGDLEQVSVNGESVVIDAGNANPAAITIEFSYELNKDEMADLLKTPFAYYQLDPALKPRNSYSGNTQSFTDPDWNEGSTIAGYYSINTSGLIVFHYTADYISYLTKSNGVKGSIYFNADAYRAESESGDRTFNFGETEVTLQFEDTKPTIQKNGSVVHTGDNYSIDWTVTIDNPTGYVDMNGYSFADKMDDTEIDWSQQSYTVEPEGSMYLDGTTLKFKKYGKDETNPTQIVLKYSTPTSLGSRTNNVATIKKGETSIPAEYPVTVENGLNVVKSGKADYEIQSGADNKIEWTVNVKHKSGDSLKNVVVTEETCDFKNAKVYDVAGNLIDASKYDVSGKILTFKNEAGIPSEVNIVFWGEATEGNNNNRVKAGRNDIPDVPAEQSVVYNSSISLNKQLIDLNEDTGAFKWQFTLSTIQNCKESLNGYTITDDAFENLTPDQIKSMGFIAGYGDEVLVNSSNETKNKYGFSIKKSETDNKTVIITFDEDNSEYDKSKPINKLNLYYDTTIEDYLSKSDLTKYQNGQTVGLYNQASAQSKNGKSSDDTGKVGREVTQRNNAVKSYFGDASETVFGNTNKTDRELNWSVSIVKDAGILNGTEFSDVLRSQSDDVPHYITPSQQTYLKNHIVGSAAAVDSGARGDLTPLSSEMYDITFYKDSALTEVAESNENAVGFKIVFKDDSTLKTYKHIYIDYKTTAETSKIKFGDQVQFSNDYTYNNETKTIPGLIFNREDPTIIPNITIGLNKSWQDSGNILGTRPDKISVRVLQAEAGDDENLPADPEWKQYYPAEGFIDLSINGSNNFTLDHEFPRWRYDLETDKIIYYYYKIEEDTVDGYTLSSISDAVKANSNQTFSLTNKATDVFGKFAINGSGNRITQVNLSDKEVPIETVTIDGKPTQCYMFAWKLIFTPGDMTSEYTDTMPSNAVYITGSENGLNTYEPRCYYDESNNSWNIQDWNLKITQNGEKLSIKVCHNDAQYMTYYTAIPIDKLNSSLDEDGNLVNKLSKNGGTPFEASIKVSGEAPTPETEPITKTAVAAGRGTIKYSIDFNPDGKNLSNTDTVDITDILSYKGGSHYKNGNWIDIPLDQLNFELEKIDMYPLINGEADKDNSIKGQLGYTVDYMYQDESPISISSPFSSIKDGAKVTVYQLSGWEPGDTVTITVDKNSVGDNTSPGFIVGYTKDFDISSIESNFSWYSNFALQNVNFSTFTGDKSSVTAVIPSNTEYLFVVGTTGSYKVGTVNYNDVYEDYNRIGGLSGTKVSPVVPAVLNLTVPDETPVRIEYTYRVEGWSDNTTGDPAYDDVVKFGNKASFKSSNGDGEADVEENKVNTSGATVTALRFPTIYKTEYGNDNIDYLSASFAVAKYEAGKWVYLKEIKTITENAGEANEKNHRELTFPIGPDADKYRESGGKYPTSTALLKFAKEDDSSTPNDKENVHEFDLKDNTLYKFVEVDAPEGYTQPNWTSNTMADNEDFIFYYAYEKYDQTKAPAEAVGKINLISSGKRVNIRNSKTIQIKVEKTFSGSANKLPEESEVTFKLYWANNKKGVGLKPVNSTTIDVESDFSSEKTIQYSASKDKNSISWYGLPTGYKGGAVYYYVREYSYKDKNGTLYTYDEATGRYLNASGQEGPFKPVYTGNGTNVDESVISVNNSEGIIVKKLWVDLDGKPVQPPKDVDSNNPMAVGFTVYGIKDSAKIRLNLPVSTLSSENEYQYILPSRVSDAEGNEYDLSEFTNFEISENLTAEQKLAMYGRYLAPKTNRVFENGTGVLEIINTDISSDTANAVVQKVWRDGGKNHSEDTLTMMLVQSINSSLTSAQLTAIANGEVIDGVYTGSAIESSDAVQLIEKGKSVTLTFDKTVLAVTNIPEGVTETHSENQLILTGSEIASGKLTVTFKDSSTKDITVSVIDYEATIGKQSDGSVNWSYNWTDLPYGDGENNYYYYAVEKNVPQDYTVSYNKSTTSVGQLTTVTNSLPTEMTVQKIWLDADGKQIVTDPEATGYESAKAETLPDSIQVQVYQKLKEETVGNAAKDKPDSMKIICLGDSITYGTMDQDSRTSNPYPNLLKNYLTAANYSNVTSDNQGISGHEILDLVDKLDNNSFSFSGVDKMCLLIGTNDILHNTGHGQHGMYKNGVITFTNEPTEAPERFEYLVRRIFEAAEAADCDDFELYVGTIPYFTRLNWIWDYDIRKETTQDVRQMIDTYNANITAKVETLKAEDMNITMVDVCSAVKVLDDSGNELTTGSMLSSDRCHPNDTGYSEIAKAFYNAINNKYLGGNSNTDITPVDISMPSTQADISKQFSGALYGTYTLEKSKGYQLGIQDLPEKNSLGVEYVYYVKEVGTHVLDSSGNFYKLSGDENKYINSVTYEHNGQLAADGGTVTIKNTIKTTQIQLQKEWKDSLEHTSDTIKVRIHRETVVDSVASKKNALILTLNVEEGEILLLPIGSKEGLSVTANKEGTLGQSGNKLDLIRKADTKTWTIKPKQGSDIAVDDVISMTFTDSDNQKYSFTVKIVDNPTLLLEMSSLTATFGAAGPSPASIQYNQPGTGMVNLTASDVEFHSTDDDILTIDANGVVTPHGLGSAEVYAVYNGVESNKVEITTAYPAFTAEAVTVSEGGKVSINPNPNYGTFTYSVNAGFEDKVSVTANTGEVEGLEAGTYEKAIRVTRNDGEFVDVNVTVEEHNLQSGDLGLVIKGSQWNYSKKATYTYDANANLVTISIPDGGTNVYNYEFTDIKTNSDLKDLIPVKYEIICDNAYNGALGIYVAGNDWEQKTNLNLSANEATEFNANGNVKISERGDSFGFSISSGNSGPFTMKIYIKESSSGGNTGDSGGDSGTFEINGKFTDNYGYKYYLDTPKNIAAGSIVTVTISNAEPNKYLQLALYDPSDSMIASASEYSNGEGVVTLTFNVSTTKTLKRFDLWNYRTDGWNSGSEEMDKSNLIFESYTITPPAAPKAAPRLTRLTTSSLLMSSTKVLTNAMKNAPPPENLPEIPADFNNEGYMDVTLNGSEGWNVIVKNLPVYAVNDGNVLPCYYWAEEIEINGEPVSGYTDSYSFSDADNNTSYTINAENVGDGIIRIRNTPAEIPSVELPESGGTGTKPYTAAGIAIMLLSGTTTLYFKRRSRRERKNA